MMNKLKWYHWAGREMRCWLTGHDLKSTWRKRPDYDERTRLDYSDIPYAERCGGKNPYFHHIAWWHHKCVRCRVKFRYFPTESWHIRQLRGIRWAWNSTRIHTEVILEEPDYSNWRLLLIPFYFLADFFVLREGWSWPADMMSAFIGLFERD